MAPTFGLEFLRQKFGFSGRSGVWKLLAILFAVLNLKNLPFAWHVRAFIQKVLSSQANILQFRLLKGLFAHLRSSRVRLASKVGPAALFQPMITSSRSGFLECDYNLHKSNSTYFSDFDVGRLELLISLATHGVEKTRKELAGDKGSFSCRLGGVSINFKREIKPYEGFEMWTRVLTWDDKWIYVIGHFVKKGVVKPKGYLLQPWKRVKETEGNAQAMNGNIEKKGPHPHIFATGISKYVFKKGRLTIPPERVLHASGLLPPRPTEHETPPLSTSPNPEITSNDAAITSAAASLTPENAGEVMAASLTAKDADSNDWTWERVERERQRGMKIAELYNGLDMLHEEFTGDEHPVLGRY